MGVFDTLTKIGLAYAAVSTGVAWFSTGFAGTAGIASLGLSAGTAGAFFARSFITSFVLGALSKTLAKEPEEVISYQDKTVTTKQSISPRKIIYGTTRYSMIVSTSNSFSTTADDTPFAFFRFFNTFFSDISITITVWT